MTDIDNIQFEERNVYPAVTWGLIAGIYFGLCRFLLNVDSSIYADPNEIKDYGLLTVFGLMYFSNWIIYILIIVWVVRIAGKLNRSQILWGILAFIFGPVTLIVIGFMDYRIEDKNVKKILDELRLDYSSEYLHIKSTKDLTRVELAEVEVRLKEKFQQKLRERISGSKLIAATAPEKMTEQERTAEQKRIEAEEDEAVQAVSDQHWTGESNKCPACGAPMGDNITTCPECGLTIN